MLDDNLNMIVTEGVGGLLNYSYELDIIQGGNSKIFENIFHTIYLFLMDEKYVLLILIKQYFIISKIL